MKRILFILALLIPICAFAQKKGAKNPALTPEQLDSTINVIYSSYDADRQVIMNQIQQATDTVFLKALYFQAASLEQRCAERMWGFILLQNQTEYTLQLMYRLRGSVGQEIVEQSLEQYIKDKALRQSDAFKALDYYAKNGYVKLGDKYRNIQLEGVGDLADPLNLSEEVKSKNILLIIGDNDNNAIPSSFKRLYGNMDHNSIDVIHVKFFKDKADAALKLAENKEEWRVFADIAGIYSNVILDYNVMDVPACFLIEKGTGNIVYEGVGITDDLMGDILTM